jgi:hypothetical protein
MPNSGKPKPQPVEKIIFQGGVEKTIQMPKPEVKK